MSSGRDRVRYRSATIRRIPARAASPADSRGPRTGRASHAAAPRYGGPRPAGHPRCTRATTSYAWEARGVTENNRRSIHANITYLRGLQLIWGIYREPRKGRDPSFPTLSLIRYFPSAQIIGTGRA